jgi:hypothetical protein
MGLGLVLLLIVFLINPSSVEAFPAKFFGTEAFDPSWQWVFPDGAMNVRADILDKKVKELSEAGVSWLRMSMQWCLIEQTPPTIVEGRKIHHYYWRNVDLMVNTAVKYGIEPVAYLFQTPRWAVPANIDPGNTYCWGGFTAFSPTDLNDWDDFVRAAVSRYSGRINYWEIWNEPDLYEFFQGRVSSNNIVQDYADLLKRAYHIIKNSGGTVLLAGLSDINGAKFAKALAQIPNITNYFDVASGHAYGNNPSYKLNMIRNIFSGKPFWATEINNNEDWCANSSYCKFPDYSLADSQFAAYISQVYTSVGLERFSWFTPITGRWGPGLFSTSGNLWDEGKQANPLPQTPFYKTFQKVANPGYVPTTPTPIAAPTATLTLIPTLTPTQIPTSSPTPMITLEEVINQWDPYGISGPHAADLNQDGKVDEIDLVLVLRGNLLN